MIRYIFVCLVSLCCAAPLRAEQASYEIKKLSENVFAAIAKPGGKSSTNAFFVVSGDHVVAGGAHMTKEAIDDLWNTVEETTHKPIRYFVLTHHHVGFSHIDTAFPNDVTLVLSGETWKSLDKEKRKVSASTILFSDAMTLKSPDAPSVVLNSIGPAHTDGDTIVVIPETKIAYVGDLLYVKSVGYMGDGHMREWLKFLDFLSELDLRQIIPGFGPPAGIPEVNDFRNYFRDFLTALLAQEEAGANTATIKQNFTLIKYKNWAGYNQFLRDNAVHAWQDLHTEPTESFAPPAK